MLKQLYQMLARMSDHFWILQIHLHDFCYLFYYNDQTDNLYCRSSILLSLSLITLINSRVMSAAYKLCTVLIAKKFAKIYKLEQLNGDKTWWM